MENAQGLEMPCLIHYPPQTGRKPTSIPDTTQFSFITEYLFGVPCATPEQAYYMGTYNELYLLHLHVPLHLRDQIPSKVLARVSTDNKTHSDMSIESEIATMVFIRSRTKIPVPIVYGYCPTRENAIGQPFSVISFTEGGSNMNSSLWESLSLDVKLKTIREYAKIVLELSKLKFDRIGSLYFKPGPIPHSYQLGPVTWCKHESGARRRNGHYDRGPWKASAAWLRAALTDEIAFMEKMPQLAQSTHKCRRVDDTRWRLAQQVLPLLRDRVTDIIEDPLDRCGSGPFVLAHMDFSPR
ncbi:hypothetical protein BT96DRAFT_1023882 [Gymnopus androsaceus JB14]|uniref:Aminoglycoside phosphotransferase domain-containing protein n=1 Tax=Gymnopus androsaceus JB14 TaxID=1447944 RepID=A0A6A4H3W7_9AGAR|nr:hypothetical protein BT96DRAFT_1023882 [Gymnopus androsaceus JB14]